MPATIPWPSSRIGRARSSEPSSSQRSAISPRSWSFKSALATWRASVEGTLEEVLPAGPIGCRAKVRQGEPGGGPRDGVAVVLDGGDRRGPGHPRTGRARPVSRRTNGSAIARFSIMSRTRAGSTLASSGITEGLA